MENVNYFAVITQILSVNFCFSFNALLSYRVNVDTNWFTQWIMLVINMNHTRNMYVFSSDINYYHTRQFHVFIASRIDYTTFIWSKCIYVLLYIVTWWSTWWLMTEITKGLMRQLRQLSRMSTSMNALYRKSKFLHLFSIDIVSLNYTLLNANAKGYSSDWSIMKTTSLWCTFSWPFSYGAEVFLKFLFVFVCCAIWCAHCFQLVEGRRYILN